jgi:hypothetical protein
LTPIGDALWENIFYQPPCVTRRHLIADLGKCAMGARRLACGRLARAIRSAGVDQMKCPIESTILSDAVVISGFPWSLGKQYE